MTAEPSGGDQQSDRLLSRGHPLPRTIGRELLVALGCTYFLLAFVIARRYLPNTLLVLIVFTLIAVSGLVLVAGGYRLPRKAVHPKFHFDVFARSFAGMVLMVAALSIYHFQPDVDLTMPWRTYAILTGFSSVAGYAVGISDARAKTHANDLERRNEQLDRMKLRLEASNDRLEQFAYAVSHDLQEPLRMVSNYLQLIENRYANDLDEEGEEFLEFAIDGARRMHEMIEGLLAYSRLESEGGSFEPVDLNEVVVEVRKNLELQITETDGTIAVEELPRIEGDESQLRMLFQNLLSNAIKYCDDEPHVEVAAERDEVQWTISVSDNGIGIDPEQQDRIFEVFQRLHTHEEYAGTGIGLALCKRIVERHEGELAVDSAPGEGTTFAVTLPAVQQ